MFGAGAGERGGKEEEEVGVGLAVWERRNGMSGEGEESVEARTRWKGTEGEGVRDDGHG